ncbi:CHRD domain-containing protein [Pseudonocardia sichuanensis]
MRRTATRIATLTALTTATAALAAGPAFAQDADVPEPDSFTSMFTAMAVPDTVVGPNGPAPGEPGATGTFDLRINSDEEIICYEITLDGVTPPYQSPARTATHVHEAAEGSAGPPRLAFPNPEDDGNGTMRSEGCLQGPFTTGVMADGTDTGEGFSLAQIEADPAAFFADTHTSAFTAGAVRGQLTRVPMGGVDTGAGGAAGDAVHPVLGAALLGVAGTAAAGVAIARRRARG